MSRKRNETPDGTEKAQKPKNLPLDAVDPADIDYTTETLYFDKCRFIDEYPMIEKSRCYLPDFLGAVFEREGVDGVSEEPNQEKMCEKYLKWVDEKNNDLPHRSYKEYQFQYNPIAFFKLRKTRKNKKEGEDPEYDSNEHRVVLKNDWDWLEDLHFALMAPITYVGGTTKNSNARYLYAFALDLDGVGMEQLQRLFELMRISYPALARRPRPMDNLPLIPTPNIIVNSGHGLHLYYTMRYPLALHKGNVPFLQGICKALYKVVGRRKSEKEGGDPGTTTEKSVHCLGIYHAFRMPETWTKTLKVTKSTGDYVGTGVPIQAWIIDTPHYTIADLLPYIWFSDDDPLYKSLTPSVIYNLERGGRLLNPKRLTLEQAREKYGEEWYQNRDKEKGQYVVKKDLYNWWFDKLSRCDGVKEGYRYYCIMALASFAKKCNVPFSRLKEDAYSLIEPFDRLTVEKDPFEKHDVNAAIKAYKNPASVRWTPDMLSSWTDIPFRKVKRNKRKREDHLKMARFSQSLDDPEGKWREGNGRKVATLENSREAGLVNEWMINHPDSKNKSLCARELNLDRKTVRKWWTQIEEELLNPEEAALSGTGKITDEIGTVSSEYQHINTSDKFKKLLADTDIEMSRKTVPAVPMAKLFAPDSDFTVPGYTHEEVVEIVITGKWKELGWDLRY